MVDVRGFNGGLNQDTANELLPAGDYIDAVNIDINQDGVVKLLGTTETTSLAATPSGTNWVCGSHFDKTRQKVYYFVFNSAGYHRIVSIDALTLVSTILFEDRTNTGGTSILGWGSEASYTPTKIIKDVKMVYKDNGGDLVYFIDPLKRPLKFNTTTLPTLSATNDVLFDYFKVIKAPPDIYPSAEYFNAAGRNVNNLRKKLFQFKYRFVYDADEKSVWSAVSKIPLLPVSFDDAYYADGTKSNGIYIALQTGGKNVKKIEIAARVNIESVWSDYFLIDTLNKSISSIGDNLSYTYEFFNDGAYIPIDIEEGNLLFDYVPDEANALELANGNTLVFGGIKEGLDRLNNFNVTASLSTVLVSSVVGNVVITSNPNNLIPSGLPGTNYALTYFVQITGNVATGDTFQFQFDVNDINTDTQVVQPILNYTVTAGQNLVDVANAIVSYLNSTYTDISAVLESSSNLSVTLKFQVEFANLAFVNVPADPTIGVVVLYTPAVATTSSGNDSISCLKWLGRYKYGIVYYTSDGKTNGVFIGDNKNLTIDIPKFSQDSFQVPYITKVQLSINHAPPSWASYYHIVRTKELTSSFSKFFISKPSNDLTETSNPIPYIYINIQNIALHSQLFPTSSTIINYSSTSFVKGDRVRFIKNQTTNTVLTTHEEYEILGVLTRGSDSYLKVTYVPGMTYLSNANHSFLIEIFRPSPIITESSDNVYYEIGESYDIVVDINGNRVHAGATQNQIIGAGSRPAILSTIDGDYYARKRNLITGTANILSQYVCMDANFSDFWESGVWSQGRSLVIDESAKTQYFPALLRFSNSYLQGSNINNLNRFYPENQEEADNSFGDILRLKTRENFIRMFQRYKTAMIPIYRSIIVDNATSTQVALSEKLLNKPNYYAGEYGIDKYGSSLVSTDYGDYFLDTVNRAIVRVSLDGLTNISDTYNVGSFTNENLDESSYGYGYFNYENRQVVMLSKKTGSAPKILSYSEPRKVFVSFHTYTSSTSFLFVNGYVWSFVIKPYIHNNADRNVFYGSSPTASITTVCNGNMQLKKTYLAVEELATELWTIDMSTGPLMNQETNLDAVDFGKTIGSLTIDRKESKYNATIKRNTLSTGGKFFGEAMKGNYAQVKLSNLTDNDTKLISVSLKYIQSPLTNM